MQEMNGPVPGHLREFWTQSLWSLHTAEWWRRHWERTGILDMTTADALFEGWRVWLEWHRGGFPDNTVEIKALEADRGEYLGYVRVVGRRRGDATLEDYCWPDHVKSLPQQYTKKPLLRSPTA